MTQPPEETSDSGDRAAGRLLLAATLLVLSLALSRGGLFTLSSPAPFIIGGPGLLLAGALAVSQRRAVQPLLSALWVEAALGTDDELRELATPRPKQNP